jgi:outer membrane protein assembly factor BamB
MDFPATDWYNKISAIKDGVLYASRSGNSNQSYIYALDASDGSVIWRSEGLTDESSSEGLNFLSNGDLIVGNRQSVLRINKIDGTTVWETYRLGYQDGAELAIYDSKIYGIVNDLGFVKVAAFDSSTGQML